MNGDMIVPETDNWRDRGITVKDLMNISDKQGSNITFEIQSEVSLTVICLN